MRWRCYQMKWCILLFIALIILYSFILDQYRSRCVFTRPETLLPQYEDYISDTRDCQVDLEKLERVDLDVTITKFDNIIKKHRQVQKGGRWKPSECKALQKVAVIIPYRDRYRNLQLLVNRLHDMLTKQMIDYRIFVLEQAGKDLFNKGKLMNIGYLEALKYDDFDCFVFHDVDLLPENDKNLYMCNEDVRHLASAVDVFNYHVWYCSLVGGATAVNAYQFKRMNGFSNSYWGWGHEDDDFAARSLEAGVMVTNTPVDIGRYTSLTHAKEKENNINNDIFSSWRSRRMHDGLNDSSGLKHTILNRTEHSLYTNITVDVGSRRKFNVNLSNKMRRESWWWEIKFYNF